MSGCRWYGCSCCRSMWFAGPAHPNNQGGIPPAPPTRYLLVGNCFGQGVVLWTLVPSVSSLLPRFSLFFFFSPFFLSFLFFVFSLFSLSSLFFLSHTHSLVSSHTLSIDTYIYYYYYYYYYYFFLSLSLSLCLSPLFCSLHLFPSFFPFHASLNREAI